MMFSRSELPRANSHQIAPISTAARDWNPHLDGLIEVAGAIAEPLIQMAKPLDIEVYRANSGLDIDVRLGLAAVDGDDHKIVGDRRTTPACARRPPR